MRGTAPAPSLSWFFPCASVEQRLAPGVLLFWFKSFLPKLLTRFCRHSTVSCQRALSITIFGIFFTGKRRGYGTFYPQKIKLNRLVAVGGRRLACRFPEASTNSSFPTTDFVPRDHTFLGSRNQLSPDCHTCFHRGLFYHRAGQSLASCCDYHPGLGTSRPRYGST